MKRIWRFIKITAKNAPVAFTLNLLYVMLLSGCFLLMGYSRKLIVDVVTQFQGVGTISLIIIVPPLIYFAAITFAGNYFNFEEMIIKFYTDKTERLLKKKFLKKSYETKQDKFNETEFYNTYSFVKDNIEECPKITPEIFNKLSLSLFSMLMVSAVVLKMNTVSFLLIILVSSGSILINRYSVRKKISLQEEYTELGRRVDYYKELLSARKNSKEMRMLNSQEKIFAKWVNEFKLITHKKFKLDRKILYMTKGIKLSELGITKSLMLFYLYLVWKKEIGIGDAVFLGTMTEMFTMGLNRLIDVITKDIKEKVKYSEKFEEFSGELNGKAEESTETDSPCQLEGEEFKSLRIKNLSYKYPTRDTNALTGIDLEVKRGETISILGYNGSGKSTLSKIICGSLEDYSGEILYNGKNIKTLPRDIYSKNYGVGFQEFSRYSLSIKENIGVGCIEEIHNNTLLNQAVSKGHIDDICSKFENGIHTILGKEYSEEGQELSGGQWQRISLARAYMGSPEILILDEPTAAIDPIEEMRMLHHFKELSEDKTTIFISHRIGFARISDRIIIIENGMIMEEGSHDELMKLEGRYYELFQSQKELYQEVI